MHTSTVEHVPLAVSVSFSADEMTVTLADGRRLSVPKVWFSRLASASDADLHAHELIGVGEGIHWPNLDEELSVAGLLR